MKGSPRVLILGAGLVARPLVEYLHGLGAKLTVASLAFDGPVRKACEERGIPAEPADATDGTRLAALVGGADLVVSLLPEPLHPVAARACLGARRPFVTTGYADGALATLDGPAREAGVLLLAECGLDPGLDHMSAMAVIHEVRKQGGDVTGLATFCGGLPAPDSSDNPFGYKFSWNPRGAILSAREPARYLRRGEVVTVPGDALLSDRSEIHVDGVGALEVHPNRDSLPYREKYTLAAATDLFRGNLRYPGHCATWLGLVRLGLLEAERAVPVEGLYWRDLLLRLNPSAKAATVEEDVARITGNAVDSEAFARYRWLGILDQIPVGGRERPPLDCLADLMVGRMPYRPGERDMVLLSHLFEAAFPERRYRITSTLALFGDPEGDTAMAKAASLPAACAAKHILEGHIRLAGVRIPVVPELFGPILSEVERHGLRFEETVESLDGEPDTEFGADGR